VRADSDPATQVLLQREGWQVNHNASTGYTGKRVVVAAQARAEALTCASAGRTVMANQVWSLIS